MSERTKRRDDATDEDGETAAGAAGRQEAARMAEAAQPPKSRGEDARETPRRMPRRPRRKPFVL